MTGRLPQVCLVRHGETAWSLSGQATGRTDLALTQSGEHDARALGAGLRDWSFIKVLTSPLRRARRTAELAGFGEGTCLDPDLTEWDHGAYEGRRTAEIRAGRPGWTLLGDGCPGGESLASVALRADRVIGRVRALNGDVLIFAHRDILRVLAVRWLGLPAGEARCLYLTTASVSVLGYHHDLGEPVIRSWNDAAHRDGSSSAERPPPAPING